MKQRADIRKQKKKKRRRRILYPMLVVFLLIAGGVGYMLFQTYTAASESYDDLDREKSDLRDKAVSIGDDPISILIMGVEDYSTNGDNGRTDTMLVATFNPGDKRLKLLSLPRDTLVEIPERGTQEKINHAHAYGGKELAIKTVEQFLDIPIDYYAAVNFDAFTNIVNILGGIEVDVPFDFEQRTIRESGNEDLQFTEGPMELNGEEALAYARMRKQDPRGDIGRNERQQQVIKAIIDKATSFGTITKVNDLAEEAGSNVKTNMSVGEGLGFYQEYSDFSASNIDKLTLETYPQSINGGSYQIPDEQSLTEVKQTLKEHLELETSNNQPGTYTTEEEQ
ncbi:LCP family protein [Lentibacillus amyloliquefaciens]|uniref:LytR family transcriptional regulator n=1 Tax=Lentibacillus amyloliquefaciens TaxID=1472767 RepID=A0A0U4FQI3_9BACI|nr:LCP family protein [Lentibacillus amyloliquefaciens]ALX49956.1 LytR family transcriptional regulator [Lentibacillus amyloliquefaciens]